LRYQPNHLARSLRSRRTNTIGVVFQHFERLSDENPYYPQLLNGVMAALFPANYTLALCPKLVQGSEAASISDGRFDGVLWCRPDFSQASVGLLRSSSTPVVMMHAPLGSAPGVPTFCADNGGALRKVVRHLVGLGHRSIGFVIDPVNHYTAEGQDRIAAFLAAVADADVRGDVLVWDYQAAEIERYRTADAPHTALAVFSDTLAGHILAACQRYGIRVPDDLSVVGFDSSSFCEETTPRLTSLHQPVERIAHEATTCLLSIIHSEHEGIPFAPPDTTIYDCGLDVRDSTSRPRTQ
jgi:LacI family transcriptional regulator